METYRKLSLVLSLFIMNLLTVVVRADIADIPERNSTNLLPIFAAVIAAIAGTLAALSTRKKK